MKNQVKWIFLGLGCLLALTGCTQAPLIEVEKGSAALLRVTKDEIAVEITRPETILEMADELNSLQYEVLELRPTEDCHGYCLEWYDDQGRLTAQADILDGQTVCYGGKLYHVKDQLQMLLLVFDVIQFSPIADSLLWGKTVSRQRPGAASGAGTLGAAFGGKTGAGSAGRAFGWGGLRRPEAFGPK